MVKRQQIQTLFSVGSTPTRATKKSVIEINNINSAGFYDCNMIKLITALENHFN